MASFDVREHGAIGDGETPDTEVVQETIDACADAAGRVVVPAGEYVTGPLSLRSNVEFHLEAGATLLGSEDDVVLLDNHLVRAERGVVRD